MDDITKSIRRFTFQFILITEVVGFVLTIGAAVLFYKTFLEMDPDQLSIAIRITLATSVFTLALTVLSDLRRLKPIRKYLHTVEQGIIDKETDAQCAEVHSSFAFVSFDRDRGSNFDHRFDHRRCVESFCGLGHGGLL